MIAIKYLYTHYLYTFNKYRNHINFQFPSRFIESAKLFSLFNVCQRVINYKFTSARNFPLSHARCVCVCVWNFPTVTKFHNTFEPWGGRERNSRKCFDNPQVIVRFGADCQFIDLSIFYVPLRLRIDSHLSLLVKDSRYCHYLWFSICIFFFFYAQLFLFCLSSSLSLFRCMALA